jgi:hypothetical protein
LSDRPYLGRKHERSFQSPNSTTLGNFDGTIH